MSVQQEEAAANVKAEENDPDATEDDEELLKLAKEAIKAKPKSNKRKRKQA